MTTTMMIRIAPPALQAAPNVTSNIYLYTYIHIYIYICTRVEENKDDDDDNGDFGSRMPVQSTRDTDFLSRPRSSCDTGALCESLDVCTPENLVFKAHSPTNCSGAGEAFSVIVFELVPLVPRTPGMRAEASGKALMLPPPCASHRQRKLIGKG